ncbi:MAG: biotin/lipoyl-binding protein [Clostridiaceae bacterium]|nr:biotin/lipoyl-binding protein [Clostridiaceae bacterium]
MRKFIVNVNGNSYEVEVEEVGGATSTQAPSVIPVAAPASKPVEAAPAPAAKAEPVKPAPAPAPAAQGSEGAVKVTAPMPGTILDVKVSVGQQVTKGTVLAILEAMKMENEILAPQDATIATVNVSNGQQVNTGDVLFTLN